MKRMMRNEEALDDDDGKNRERVKEICRGCLKERFFDFVFEAEEFNDT